ILLNYFGRIPPEFGVPATPVAATIFSRFGAAICAVFGVYSPAFCDWAITVLTAPVRWCRLPVPTSLLGRKLHAGRTVLPALGLELGAAMTAGNEPTNRPPTHRRLD